MQAWQMAALCAAGVLAVAVVIALNVWHRRFTGRMNNAERTEHERNAERW